MHREPSQHHVLSQRLLHEVVHSSQSAFIADHGAIHYLAVSAGDSPELLEGLDLLRGEARPARPLATMAFKTNAGTRHPPAGSLRPNPMLDRGDLLASGHYHVLEIGKRGELDGAFPERISIGRAANKDIVLRHESVSKFHGWFEVDAALCLYVVDAGSTNHTIVQRRQLAARAREPAPPGTPIRFGSIDTVVVDAASLWMAFHARSA